MSSQEDLIEFLNARIEALKTENERLKISVQNATDILNEILKDAESVEVVEPETVKP